MSDICNPGKLIFIVLFFCQFLMQSCGGGNLAKDNEKGTEFQSNSDTIRFATYNVSLFRKEEGALAKDLKLGRDTQIQNVAGVIQHVRPDVIALMEFDYDASGLLLDYFQQNYLSKSQYGEEPIDYNYAISVPSNTGVLSNADFSNDGKIELPADAYGFGRYEGQYAFALLSKYPLDTAQIRSFQKFLWKDMPDVKQPKIENGGNYYSEKAWGIFRVSSKNHIDIPIKFPNGKTIHTIIAHPTPPVFDGPEDRNGLRNFDEIRLLKDYVSGENYLVDDNGGKGGLNAGSSFVIMGDLNADPIDGDSPSGAIDQLLSHPNVNNKVTIGNLIPSSNGGKVHNKSIKDKGDPAFDTSFFGKRVDYVIPSNDIKVITSGVLWPTDGEPLYEQVKNKSASDHLLVWVDIVVKNN